MKFVILLKKETHKNRKKKEKFPLTLCKPTKNATLLSLFDENCVYKDTIKSFTFCLGIVQPQWFGQVSGNRRYLVT